MATHRVVSDYTKIDSATSNVKVYVRARPLESNSETFDFIEPKGEAQLVINDPDMANRKYGEVSFQFDRVFWTDTLQEDVFINMCKAQVDHILSGFNSCCFAYGQTGSGKTFTMFGNDGVVRGIIPRSVEYLFRTLAARESSSEIATVCSFLEIYNDQIRDLGKAYLVASGMEGASSAAVTRKTSTVFESLADKRSSSYFAPAFTRQSSNSDMTPMMKEVNDEYNSMNYEIREDAEGNVFVKDLSLVPVSSVEEAMAVITMGLKIRATHETKMNAFSSRSHTVFTVTVLQRDRGSGEAISGMLNLVDLAGSERLKKSESQGKRLKEALHINTSLTALGKVIMALDPSVEASHIPYRDSKLTRVLQNSLGGNSYTSVLATIYPHPTFFEECLSTLQFANRCRNVKNNPRVNYVGETEDKDKKIKRLLEEIAQLRQRIAQLEAQKGAGKKISPDALVKVLRAMGMTASYNGNIFEVNGKPFTFEELGLAVSDNESIMTSATGSGSQAGHLVSSVANKIMRNQAVDKALRMKETIDDMKRAEGRQKDKIKMLQDTIASAEEDGKKLTEELLRAKAQVSALTRDVDLMRLQKDQALKRLETSLSEKYQGDMRELAKQSTSLLQGQLNKLTEPSNNLKAYNETSRRMAATGLTVNFGTTINGTFDTSTVGRGPVVSHDEFLRERRLLEEQYNMWLRQKDEALQDFVHQFNVYKAKKSEQLRKCEKEIIELFEYAEKLEHILDDVEKKKFVMRETFVPAGTHLAGMNVSSSNSQIRNDKTLSGGMRIDEIMLPSGIRPINPVKRKGGAEMGKADFALSKRLIQRHREQAEKIATARERAFIKALAHATRNENAVKETLPDGRDFQDTLNDFIFHDQESSVEAAVAEPRTKEEWVFKPMLSATASAPSLAAKSKPGPNSSKTAIGLSRPSTASSVMPETQTERSPHFAKAGRGLNLSPDSPNCDLGVHRTAIDVTGTAAIKDVDVSPSDAKLRTYARSVGAMSEVYLTEREMLEKIRTKDNEISALQKELANLRLTESQAKVTVDNVLVDLKSNDTLLYVQALETERGKLRRRIQELSGQLTTVKIAHAALARRPGSVDGTIRRK